MAAECTHLNQLRDVRPRSDRWNESMQPGEIWRWCYVGEIGLE